MVSCAGVKFGCREVAVVRVLVHMVDEIPNGTAIFDKNMREDQHCTTYTSVELVGSVNIGLNL